MGPLVRMFDVELAPVDGGHMISVQALDPFGVASAITSDAITLALEVAPSDTVAPTGGITSAGEPSMRARSPWSSRPMRTTRAAWWICASATTAPTGATGSLSSATASAAAHDVESARALVDDAVAILGFYQRWIHRFFSLDRQFGLARDISSPLEWYWITTRGRTRLADPGGPLGGAVFTDRGFEHIPALARGTDFLAERAAA